MSRAMAGTTIHPTREDLLAWAAGPEERLFAEAERLTADKGKLYPILTVRGGEMPPATPAESWGGFLLRDDPLWGLYLEDRLLRLRRAAAGLARARDSGEAAKETELREEYPERKVFQLSFCMNGICEWNYRESGSECYQLSPTQCSLQCGTFSQCVSHFSAEKPYRTLSISLEQERFSPLIEDLEAMHLVRQDNKICTHVFSTSPGIRFVLQQLLDCPPERKLRKLYLEGKVLELVSLFCDEVVGTQKKRQGNFPRGLPLFDEGKGDH